MKNIVVLSLLLGMSGCSACGDSSRQNELVGQAKKVIDRTPVICPNYTEADVSLGVMRNGVGSMSHEDVILYVTQPRDRDTLKKAAEQGQLVKVTYDVKRISICFPDHWVTSVSIVEDPKPEASK